MAATKFLRTSEGFHTELVKRAFDFTVQGVCRMISGNAHRFNYVTLRRVHKKFCLTRRNLIQVLVLMLTITAVAACKSKTGLFVTGNENPTFEIRRGYFDEVRVFSILTVVKLDPRNERLAATPRR